MRKKVVLLVLSQIICFYFISCNKNESLYNPDGNKTEIDQTFTFSTRSSVMITINAIDAVGKAASSAMFSVYDSYPYIEKEDEDTRINSDLKPVFQGFTNESGIISTELSISSDVDTLYVIPEYSGFGCMQAVTLQEAAAGLTFKGRQLVSSSARSSRAEENVFERDATKRGNNYYFYSYFNDSELNISDGSLNVGNGVVTSDPLSTDFLALVNALFPEGTNYENDLKKNTDIKITDDEGAEVFVTFIGDGGFVSGNNTKTYNSLYYYIYTDNNTPSKRFNVQSPEYQLTCVFPNVHTSYISAGTKVQLLYWNGNKYVNKFPKGTYIGFCMNFKGYNKDNGMGFSLVDNYIYCTTPIFNQDKDSHGISIWNEQYKCYILGMERQGVRYGGDGDFNDILGKVTVSSAKQQSQQEIVFPTSSGYEAKYSQSGTLAFEDNWPKKGDYDFNDFVTRYSYTLVANVQNQITKIILEFTPQAVGASNSNGFGIELPVDRNNIKSPSIPVEEGMGKPVFIVYDNVRSGFQSAGGFINTQKGSSTVVSETKKIEIEFNTPVDKILFKDFNPFLFVNSRNHEIHLVDYAPTSKMNSTLLATGDDQSDSTKNLYYRMDNNFPWALDLSSTSWKWPLEHSVISEAYKNYNSWYESWKEGNVAGWMNENIDEQYLW